MLRMSDRHPAPARLPRLRGRRAECAALDEMIAAVREGMSRTLVVRGEAGVGKTALLEYMVEAASDLRVVRAVGWRLRWSWRSPPCISCARR
jgi:Cdc6-like AAA superfamily ATPase